MVSPDAIPSGEQPEEGRTNPDDMVVRGHWLPGKQDLSLLTHPREGDLHGAGYYCMSSGSGNKDMILEKARYVFEATDETGAVTAYWYCY